jgi:hypothetical protein
MMWRTVSTSQWQAQCWFTTSCETAYGEECKVLRRLLLTHVTSPILHTDLMTDCDLALFFLIACQQRANDPRGVSPYMR